MKSRSSHKAQVQLAPDLVVEETMQAGVHRLRRVSPLEFLKNAGHITARQFDAGERFRDDYEGGVVGVNMGQSPSIMICSTRGDPWAREVSIRRLGYLKSYSGAVGCLAVDSRAILEAVVARGDKTCAELERGACRRKGWAVERLKVGLDLLAGYYRV